jgi:hypothetical protein
VARTDVAAFDAVHDRLDSLVVHTARAARRPVRTELTVLVNNVHLILR